MKLAVWRLEYPLVKVSLMVNISIRHFRRSAVFLIKSHLQPGTGSGSLFH